MKNLVWKGVIRGAVLAAIIAATASILANYVSREDSSNMALVLVLLLGFVLGGFAAGREAPGYAFTNGAAAALLAFVAVEVIGIASRVARGETDQLNPFRIIFLGLLSVSCGVVGGAVAIAADQRKQAREAKDQEGSF